MKSSLILIAAFLFLFQISKAQTEKGSQSLGANAAFTYYQSNGATINPLVYSTSRNDSKNTIFSAGPVYSYFIADNLDLGAALNYSSVVYNNGPNYMPAEQHNKSFSSRIYLRKYFMYKNKLGLRAGPYLGYIIIDNKYLYTPPYDINNSDAKSHGYNAGGNLDLVYYPAKHLGVSVTLADLSYTHSRTNSGSQGFSNTDQVSFGFVSNDLELSLLYVFGGK